MSDHPLSVRPVQGYEGRYEVDSDGNIYSLLGKIRKQLKPQDTNGYHYLPLWKDGKSSWCSVHRIVAKAFLEKKPQDVEVNHIDKNKKNNRVANLEWCTRQENMAHACAKSYKVIDPSGALIAIHNLEQFCKEHNLDASNMKKVMNGLRKVHKGYTAP